MIKDFININRDKIRSFALLYGVLIGLMVLIIFFAGAINARLELSIWLLMLLYILIVAAVTALFIVVFVLDGWIDFRKKRNIFNHPTWKNYLAKHGFETVHTLQTQRFRFTQEVKSGNINGFVVVADLSKDKKNHLQFRFYVGNNSIDKEEYRRLSKLLKNVNGGLEFGYLYKYIRADKSLTVLRIEQEVYQFADLLLANGLIPTVK